jgi:DME family drug/metabolite transporter
VEEAISRVDSLGGMLRRRTLALGPLFVAVAAALWGADALLRRPLAQSTTAATIVFGEHIVLVAATLPFLLGALVAVWKAGPRYVAAAIVVGAGASALATILFTEAFVRGSDPVTPVVLQKVQPLVAVIGARLILGEHPRKNFFWFLLGGLAGAWLIAFPDPNHISAHGLTPVLLALGAAVLWAMGTVLGRLLTTRISFQHVTALRFAFGLPASALAVLVLGAPAFPSGHDFLWIAALALVTGLVALSLYYYGLQRTPAVTASLAELAFPVSATLVGYLAFDATLTGTQWLGLLVTTLVVLLLPVRSKKLVDVEHEPGSLAPAHA